MNSYINVTKVYVYSKDTGGIWSLVDSFCLCYRIIRILETEEAYIVRRYYIVDPFSVRVDTYQKKYYRVSYRT